MYGCSIQYFLDTCISQLKFYGVGSFMECRSYEVHLLFENGKGVERLGDVNFGRLPPIPLDLLCSEDRINREPFITSRLYFLLRNFLY